MKEIEGKILEKSFKSKAYDKIDNHGEDYTTHRIAFSLYKDKEYYNFVTWHDEVPAYIAPNKRVNVTFDENKYNETYKNYDVDISVVRSLEKGD